MSLLQFLGNAAVPTVICLILGLLLLFIELFIPGFGVAGISGIILLVASVVLQFLFGSPLAAGCLAAGVLVLILIVVILFFRSMQKGRLSRSFIVLNDSIAAKGGEDNLEKLVGVTGVTVTALRPSGVAQIRGNRISVMTKGEFIEAGVAIVVTGADGMTPVVEKDTSEAGV